MQEKAEQSIWLTKTPLGYRNVTGPDGKKIIATDAAIAPLIAKLFDWYARVDISLKEAARKAHAAGLLYPKSGAKVPVSTVHTILRNRLYTGWFEWNGTFKASTRRWCRWSYGSACRACSMAVSPRRPSAASMILPFPG